MLQIAADFKSLECLVLYCDYFTDEITAHQELVSRPGLMLRAPELIRANPGGYLTAMRGRAGSGSIPSRPQISFTGRGKPTAFGRYHESRATLPMLTCKLTGEGSSTIENAREVAFQIHKP